MARILSAVPPFPTGPSTVVIFDIHALQVLLVSTYYLLPTATDYCGNLRHPCAAGPTSVCLLLTTTYYLLLLTTVVLFDIHALQVRMCMCI